MYGTIATFKVKPGQLENLRKFGESESRQTPGLVFEHIYQMDSDSNTVMMVVGFKDKDAYAANADSPEMHERYLTYRSFLESDPEWHDGEIIFSQAM
jgi:quinol monooxygenase YgiN